MKKRLLMQCLALAVAAGAYAFQVDDYIYTKTAKLKVTGENLVTNGNFDQGTGTDGWTSEKDGPLASNWAVTPAAGPNGENVMASTGAAVAEGTAMTRSWALQQGQYAISYKIKSSTGSVSIASGGTNFVSFFANADASQTVGRQISEAVSFTADEWTEIVDTIQVNAATEYLVFLANNVVEGTQLTNFEIHKVDAVFDTRPFEKRIAYMEKLLEDPNFSVAEAAQIQKQLTTQLGRVKQGISNNQFDNGLSNLDNQLEQLFTKYLDVTSTDITQNSYFQYIEDLEDMPQYNRGNIKNAQVIGGFKFYGDNWQHGVYRDASNKIIEGPNGKKGLPHIMKQIQGTSSNPCGPGAVTLVNSTLPAGKYFVEAEMYNAKCLSNYSLDYTLETAMSGFVGSDTIKLDTLAGEGYRPVYFVAELKEGESFEAGFYWNNNFEYGANWTLTNFKVRTFVKDAEAQVKRAEAWNAFKAQWDAATNNRKKVIELQGDVNYRWAKDSLQRALDQWDPYYYSVINDSLWVDAEGNDTRVANADQLNAWAKTQGFVLADTTATSTDAEKAFFKAYSQYAVVRGYQYAANYVVAQNKPIFDLEAAVKDAIAVRDDAMNVQGDKAAFQTAIDAAQAVVTDVKANSTDATRETDEPKVTAQLEALAAAKVTFLKSAELKPIIDIDFSNTFEEVKDDAEEVVSYVIRGAAGEMSIAAADVDTDNTADVTKFQLGFGTKDADTDAVTEKVSGVLRVGKGTAIVELPEAPADDDVIRASFDVWFGKFVKYGYLAVELRNAADQRIAGFSYCRYDNATKFNDFANFDLGKSNNIGNVNNDAIYTDKNKSALEIIVDGKAKGVQAILTNEAGVFTSDLTPVANDITDTKVAKFVLSSEYTNAGRRSWFDNLKIYKYMSQAEGPITGISTVSAAEKAVKGGIYTINGVRVAAPAQKGLYIINGKKVVVK